MMTCDDGYYDYDEFKRSQDDGSERHFLENILFLF